jgi:hypothetical protein
VSQPPYGYPPHQPDPHLQAPVDPYQSPAGPPGYDQPAYPGSPAYPAYSDPVGYPDPVSGYPAGQPYQTPAQGYADPGYQQPAYYPPAQQPVQQPAQPGYGGPGYPGTGYAPAPAGGSNRAVVMVLMVALVVILVGGGIGVAVVLAKKNNPPSASGSTGTGGTGTGGTGSASASANPSPSDSPSPTAATIHTGDLRRYLIDPPSGSRNWTNPLGTDRNLSIDQASELSSDKAARKRMFQQYNFAKGAVQCWIASGSTSIVDVRLYQFDTEDHANSFFKENIEATGGGYTAANTNSVPGVPRAESYSNPKKDDQGLVNVIAIGVKGDVVFVVSLGEKADTIDLDLPNSLMLKQYQKL